jgi:hypothetical protein
MTRRSAIRAALRLARGEHGASTDDIPDRVSKPLVDAGLLRRVEHRVSISGQLLEVRLRTTAKAEVWLDEDVSP